MALPSNGPFRHMAPADLVGAVIVMALTIALCALSVIALAAIFERVAS